MRSCRSGSASRLEPLPSLVRDGGAVTEHDEDARYGRTRNRKVDRIIVFSTIGVVLLGVLVWALFGGWGGNAVSVSYKDLGFTIQDDQVTVKYQVSAPANSKLACALESMSESFASVAWKVVEIEPSEKITRSFSDTMRTIREPNSAYVVRCWIPETE